MEYLNDINDSLNSYNESGLRYVNLFEHPELFYGTVYNEKDYLDFTKFPTPIIEEVNNFSADAITQMSSYHNSGCGVRLRFSTDSTRLIFKVKLKRRWSTLKIVNWGSFAFDVYGIEEDKYSHRTVFAPNNALDTFAESILVPENGKLCIFLPNFNSIEELYMGIDSESCFERLDYPAENRTPVLFFGSATAQGASASHSGNSYPNIVSKLLDRDIVNLSCSAACIATKSMSQHIGKMECDAIVLDYNLTATEFDELDNISGFYTELRKYFPDKRIILMTCANFNNLDTCDKIDEKITNIYQSAVDNGEDTWLINQRDLFKDEDPDLICVDSSHYTDCSMYKVARKICDILEK